jgi:hypothetical protein
MFLRLDEPIRLFRALALIVGAGLLLAYATAAYAMEPPRIVDAFARARAERDLDAALSLFTDNAVVSLERGREQVFAGKTEIRHLLTVLDLSAPLITASPAPLATSPNTITWSESDQQNPTRELTGEATIEGGKIARLVYRPGTLVPTQQVPTQNMSLVALSSGASMVAVVLFGVGLGSLVTVRPQRIARSALQGRLVRHLGSWRLERRIDAG